MCVCMHARAILWIGVAGEGRRGGGEGRGAAVLACSVDFLGDGALGVSGSGMRALKDSNRPENVSGPARRRT